MKSFTKEKEILGETHFQLNLGKQLSYPKSILQMYPMGWELLYSISKSKEEDNLNLKS